MVAEKVHVEEVGTKALQQRRSAAPVEAGSGMKLEPDVVRLRRRVADDRHVLERIPEVLDQVDDEARRTAGVEVADHVQDARPVGRRRMHLPDLVRAERGGKAGAGAVARCARFSRQPPADLAAKDPGHAAKQEPELLQPTALDVQFLVLGEQRVELALEERVDALTVGHPKRPGEYTAAGA